MKNFSDYDVEFYMWGGEPFCIDGTFDLVKGFIEYDFVRWARIDSNMTYTKKILQRCSSSKIKFLCSWHTENLNFEQYWKLINQFKEKNMVGMANFVASDTNMRFLQRHSLILDDLIKRFMDSGIFFNVAADFNKGEDPEYREFITQYMTEEDWDHIHGNYPSKNAPCDASNTFFSVHHDGSITSCGIQRKNLFNEEIISVIVGDFLDGKLKRRKKTSCPVGFCKSIVAYPHRLDNDFQPVRHLESYIERNIEHRKRNGKL
jgi:MoaA/NifB/PqqE/SkfB family radical SAM enzyme